MRGIWNLINNSSDSTPSGPILCVCVFLMLIIVVMCRQIGVAYVSATTSAVAVAVGLNSLIKVSYCSIYLQLVMHPSQL